MNQVPYSPELVQYNTGYGMPHCHGFKDDVEEIIGMSRLPVFVCYRVLLRDNT